MSIVRKSILILFLVSFSSSANAQQFAVASKADQPPSGSVKVSKNILLYRSLMLQDFDKSTVEQVYGMHGQSWIKEKLKLGADTEMFLSTGFSEHSERPWRAPDPTLIEAIGLERVQSVNDAKDNDLIVIVENVDWVTADLVNLNISTYHKELGGGIHGSVEVELEFKNNKWIIISNGGCWMRRFKAMPAARITNQFGMTFRLVTIDTSRSDHKDSFPKKSYYLQETELTVEQHLAFRKAAFGDGSFETIDWNVNAGYPSEWREVFRYGEALSRFDTEYDYRLPSRQEWSFACMNGYDQTCPGEGAKSTIDSSDSKRPNKYGIDGFMNYDVECADVPGLFLGKFDNRAGAYENGKKPTCRCDQYTKGNPDGDDGLNELIAGRFVLVPQPATSNNGK